MQVAVAKPPIISCRLTTQGLLRYTCGWLGTPFVAENRGELRV